MKFSIITPSFNQAGFLEQTIKSVVSQEVDLEYFIQDGGSSDGSAEIIKKYADKYPFIKWESKKDAGQVDALNQCLPKCTGDIVAYLNSDDYYLPGALKAVNIYFENHQKQWVAGGCRVSDKKLSWTFFLKNIWPIEIHSSFLQIFNTINQPSVFIKNDLIKKVGMFDKSLTYAFDYDYWLRCQKIAGTPGRITQILSVFRIHQASKGNTGYKEQFAEDFAVVKKYTRKPFIEIFHSIGRILVEIGYRNLKRN